MSMTNDAPVVGRNEPCPCGSGKKYKRCHGVDAAPKLTEAKKPAGDDMASQLEQAGMPAGFDPSQMDPKYMADMQKAFQRMPKGQMRKLQGLIQAAMSGKDVSRELGQMEKTLPSGLQDLMKNSPWAQAAAGKVDGKADGGASDGAGADGSAGGSAGEEDMSLSEAKKLVADAVKRGELSEEEAQTILDGQATGGTKNKKSLWNRLRGK